MFINFHFHLCLNKVNLLIKDKLEISHLNLTKLKAIEQNEITELVKILAYIPLAPKFAKLLLLTRSYNILHYGLLLVSVLSTEELF